MEDYNGYNPQYDKMSQKPREEAFVDFLDNVSLHSKVWTAAAVAIPAVIAILVGFNCLLH